MVQPLARPFQFQPFLDYAPPVRAGRWPSHRDRGIMLLRRLAGAVVLLTTCVGAFVLARDYGFGWTSVLLGTLGLTALAARGQRSPLPSALVVVLRGIARLLRITSLLCLTFILAVALQCVASGYRLWDMWLLLAMLAAIPAALELLRALLRWRLSGDGNLAHLKTVRADESSAQNLTPIMPDLTLGRLSQGKCFKVSWLILPGIAKVWIRED